MEHLLGGRHWDTSAVCKGGVDAFPTLRMHHHLVKTDVGLRKV